MESKPIAQSLKNRQCGAWTPRQFASQVTTSRLSGMTFCRDMSITEEEIEELELSHDKSLLLASDAVELKVYKTNPFEPFSDNILSPVGEMELDLPKSHNCAATVCLRWHRSDSSLFTKSGGSLEVWNVENLDEPSDTSENPDRDFRHYTYNSMDPYNMCIIAGVVDSGSVDLLDLRIGLDNPVLELKGVLSAKRKICKIILNASFNPVEEKRITTVLRDNESTLTPFIFGLCDYDTRQTKEPLFKHLVLHPHKLSHFNPTHTQLQFSENGQKVFMLAGDEMFCVDSYNGNLLSRSRLPGVSGNDKNKFCLSSGTTSDLLFIPTRYGLSVHDATDLSSVNEFCPPASVCLSQRKDVRAIAGDTGRQTFYVGHNDLHIYSAVPGDEDGDDSSLMMVDPC